MVAVATFGGNAQKVWRLLLHESPLAGRENHAAMAPPTWDRDAAQHVVQALLDQHRRRSERDEARRRAEAAHERRRRWVALVAGGLFVASILPVSLGLRGFEPGTWPLFAVVLLTPLVAGAAGATTRMVFEPDTVRGAVVTSILGLVAGGISVLLFLASQFASTPDLLGKGSQAAEQASNLSLFAVIIGFIAGFTFESVYRKLAPVDVVRTEMLERT